MPCSPAGKTFVIFYALFSIPLFVVLLNNMGKILAIIFTSGWKLLVTTVRSAKRFCIAKYKFVVSRRRHSEGDAQWEKEHHDASHGVFHPSDKKLVYYRNLPVSVSLGITAAWLLVSTTVFYVLEKNWLFGDCFYFIMISVLTVGFGDIAPTHHEVSE